MDVSAALVKSVNDRSSFNRWLGIEVVEVAIGSVSLKIKWREELGQYSGHLHAGIIGTMIDTACGFSGLTVTTSKFLASNFSVNFLRPAVGDSFIAEAQVIKPGRLQIFTRCDLYSLNGSEKKLVANGDTILCVLPEGDWNDELNQ
ncbi:PaaI family thioesterase [Burkholderiales bacterium]|nr:PaaI family thioesterase [Burkholderiales bacterium]